MVFMARQAAKPGDNFRRRALGLSQCIELFKNIAKQPVWMKPAKG